MSASYSNPGNLTTAQLEARKISMAVFRRREFTLAHATLPWMMRTAIAQEVAGYRHRNPHTIEIIAGAYPDEIIKMEAGCRTFADWLDEMAIAVISDQIQRVVALPRFGGFDGDCWLFLGGSLRNHRDLPLTDMQRGLPHEDDDYVDLWGGRDGTQVMVRYGRGQFDYVPGHVDDTAKLGSHVREALRRLALLDLRRLPA